LPMDSSGNLAPSRSSSLARRLPWVGISMS
jgi:hypothetical protein